MASIKHLKKRVKGIVYEVLDDCDFVIVNNGAKADEADALIDEAVEFHESMMQRINAAKSHDDFRAIREDLSKKEEDFVKRLNGLS